MVARISSSHHRCHPRSAWRRWISITLTANALGFLENVFNAMYFTVNLILQGSSRAQSGLVPILDVALLCRAHRRYQEEKLTCVHTDVD